MEKLKLRSGPFHRIGDQYRHMMGNDHFMGRDAFADSWIAPSKIKLTNGDKSDTVELVIPGFNKEEINVVLDGYSLSVHAKKKAPLNYLRNEFNTNSVRALCQLPKNINLEKISSSYENGVLTIKLPYRMPRVRHRVDIT